MKTLITLLLMLAFSLPAMAQDTLVIDANLLNKVKEWGISNGGNTVLTIPSPDEVRQIISKVINDSVPNIIESTKPTDEEFKQSVEAIIQESAVPVSESQVSALMIQLLDAYMQQDPTPTFFEFKDYLDSLGG